MPRYIALLRGINVSGHKKIKMADLRASLDKGGFENVETYIQSGNIALESIKSAVEIKKLISKIIKKNFGFDVPVIITTRSELKKILFDNPFSNTTKKDYKSPYVTFLDKKPTAQQIKSLKEFDFSPEEFVVGSRHIYLHSPNGYQNAKMSNNFFEKQLKQEATSRNWKTVNVLYEMLIK